MKITEQTVIIDGIDKVILKTLMQDARKPILAISKITGISGAAVHQRLKKLEKAKVSYSKASQLKPEETYPNEQIVKIEAQLTAIKELEAKYTASITEGDNALTAKEYDKAILAYKKASGLKGEKEYPKLKLTEIEGLIAELKGK